MANRPRANPYDLGRMLSLGEGNQQPLGAPVPVHTQALAPLPKEQPYNMPQLSPDMMRRMMMQNNTAPQPAAPMNILPDLSTYGGPGMMGGGGSI